MRTFKKTIKETREIDKKICDICKQEIKQKGSWQVDDIDICGKFGDIYPEIDSREFKIIDCCSDCFNNKIVPLIEKTFSIDFRAGDMEDFYNLEV